MKILFLRIQSREDSQTPRWAALVELLVRVLRTIGFTSINSSMNMKDNFKIGIILNYH